MPQLKLRCYFKEIVIIESLRKSDKKTGKALYQSLMTYNQKRSTGVSLQFYPIASFSEFSSTIDKIFNRFKQTGNIPILHLELHGSNKGLQFMDGSIGTWENIKPFLIKLNVSMHNYLLVTVAVIVRMSWFQRMTMWAESPRSDDRSHVWDMV